LHANIDVIQQILDSEHCHNVLILLIKLLLHIVNILTLVCDSSVNFNVILHVERTEFNESSYRYVTS